MKLLVLTGFLTCFIINCEAQLNNDSSTWPPDFCGIWDCPYYTVLELTQEYEKRQYSATKWVSSREEGAEYETATYATFMRLKDYISGKNSENQTMEMTVPVLIKITYGSDEGTYKNDFTRFFYIPSDKGDPPLPSNSQVQLKEMDRMVVYVSSFSGRPNITEWMAAAANLKENLPPSADYIGDYFFRVGYSSPYQTENRHNEVWFIAQE